MAKGLPRQSASAMPEPRVHLLCGQFLLARDGSEVVSRPTGSIRDLANRRSRALRWKIEALVAVRNNRHPQPAVEAASNRVTLQGFNFTFLANSWRNEQVWQVEYVEETTDITSFYLKTNFPDDKVKALLEH